MKEKSVIAYNKYVVNDFMTDLTVLCMDEDNL